MHKVYSIQLHAIKFIDAKSLHRHRSALTKNFFLIPI